MSPPAPSLNALLARRLAQAPDDTAWLLADGAGPPGLGPRVSARQFEALVCRSAEWLAGQGVGTGDRVALWLVNRIEWLALVFGAARLGAAVLCVNTRYRAAEVADLLQRGQPRLLVLQARFRSVDFLALLADAPAACADSLAAVALLPPALGEPPDAAPQTGPAQVLGRPCVRLDMGPWLAPRAAEPEAQPDHADAPIILFSTSGTTSGPKLVQHTQRTVAAHLHAIAHATGLGDAGALLLAALPLAGTFGFVSALAAWAAGRPVLLHPSWDAAAAAADVRRHAVTHLFGSDEMFEGLLRQADPAYPSLRLCGFAAFRGTAQQVAEQAVARGLPMVGLYGSSEVHALFAIQPLNQPLAERLAGGGRPLNPAAQVRVRDAETGALLPVGQPGLLEIRSPSNFIGYLGQAAATASAIDAEGWFSTGDIGHLRPDGSFVYTTRAGDAVRLGGYLVAPAEIEAALQALPGIAAAQVVAVDIAGKARAVAFVLHDPDAAWPPGLHPHSALALAQWAQALLARQLAAYKLPARLWLLPAFPVVHSANGTKVQRHRLRALALQHLAQEASGG